MILIMYTIDDLKPVIKSSILKATKENRNKLISCIPYKKDHVVRVAHIETPERFFINSAIKSKRIID